MSTRARLKAKPRPARSSTRSAPLAGPSSGKKRTKVRSISPILLKFKEDFPGKTALQLALRTGASVSQCEKALDGRRRLGGEYVEALLASDFGGAALEVIARGSDAAWAGAYLRQRGLSEARRLLAEGQAKVRALEEAGGV